MLPWTWSGPGPWRPCCVLGSACSVLVAAEVKARPGRRAVPTTAPEPGLRPHVQTVLGLWLQRAAPSCAVPHSQPALTFPCLSPVSSDARCPAGLHGVGSSRPPRLQLFVLTDCHGARATPSWGLAPSSLRRGSLPMAPPARRKVHLLGGRWWAGAGGQPGGPELSDATAGGGCWSWPESLNFCHWNMPAGCDSWTPGSGRLCWWGAAGLETAVCRCPQGLT